MNITVQVDEVTLDTAVREATEYDEDADGFRQPPTVGHLVAAQIVDRLIRTDGWQSFSSAVLQVRTDLIREAVRPLLAEAIAAPVQKTNSYGEPVGGTVTLRERDALTQERLPIEGLAEEMERRVSAPWKSPKLNRR